jgi:hypothetical protein
MEDSRRDDLGSWGCPNSAILSEEYGSAHPPSQAPGVATLLKKVFDKVAAPAEAPLTKCQSGGENEDTLVKKQN